ncbi:MAG: hypothetical protein AAGC71_06460 [Pseudomonadota bacterium]
MTRSRIAAVFGVFAVVSASPASAQVIDIWSVFLNQQPEVEEEVEQSLSEKIAIAIPLQRRTPPCDGIIEVTYNQFDDVARVNAELKATSCPVSQVKYSLAVNARDSEYAISSQRFDFVWEVDSGKSFPGSDSYWIGRGRDLISVRASRFSCQCAAPNGPSVVVDDGQLESSNSTEPLWF